MGSMTIVRALLVPMLLAAAAPSAAQTLERVEGRVKKLESEMRAVQRKVFPGASKDYFEPEITAPAAPATAPGIPASSPISDLTQRVNSLEQQMTTLTGQVEEATFKLRQLEAQLAKFKSDADFRLSTLEGGTQPSVATPAGAAAVAPAGQTAPKPSASTATASEAPPQLDPIEAEYRAGYGFVAAKDYAKAETALAAFLAKHPAHARASNAQYWLGRTYFAQNRPVQAARTLLENYQKRPEGERAPESLLWLGKSLMAFSPPSPAKACEAYDQLDASYGGKLSASLRAQLAEARAAAKCG
jgi:tol-pal system protein YbgF